MADLRFLANACRRRCENKKDAVVCVTGEEGEGKTTFAIQLARLIHKGFRLQKNMLLDPDVKQLYDMIYNLPAGSPIIVDELIRVAYKRNWYEKKNKLLVEMYVLCRYQQKVSIFCVPQFNLVDADLRRRVLFWVHVPKQGTAIILRKDRNQFTTDVWNMRDNEKIIHEKLRFVSAGGWKVEDYVKVLKRSKNYVGVCGFEKLDDATEKEYDSLKVPFELRGLEQEYDKREQKTREQLGRAVVIFLKQGKTPMEIVEMIGCTYDALRNLVLEQKVTITGIKKELKAEAHKHEVDKLDDVKTELDAIKTEAIK